LDERHGSLLRHEFAYVMGQIRDERCCSYLEQVLLNKDDCIMVRHECGEALGAISAKRSIPILQQAIESNPNTIEISQTCQLALSYMEWKINKDELKGIEQPMVCACMIAPYSSVDPAPPHPDHVHLSTKEIGKILCDDSLPLFQRYRAMFSLRNRGGVDSVYELGEALVHDTSSALLRHEVAYVLGQMQHSDSVEALTTSLQRKNEHSIVRHESAEALGAIEDKWDVVEASLKLFLEDDDIVVRESCIVALDAANYWGYSNNNTTSDDGNNVNIVENVEGNESNVKQSFAQAKALPVN